MSNYQAVYDATMQAARSTFSGNACDAVERATSDALGNLGPNIVETFRMVAAELERPSRTMRPRIFIDGNQWCALYGDNLQDGVAGFGDSPESACRSLDSEWVRPIGSGAKP